MTTMTFRTDDPTLAALDVVHSDKPGGMGRHLEQIALHPSYLDANHPLHARAVAEMSAGLALLVGDAPTAGASGFTLSFNSAEVRPAVAPAAGQPPAPPAAPVFAETPSSIPLDSTPSVQVDYTATADEHRFG